MSASSLNRVEINLDALQTNYQAIKALVGPRVNVMGMVKSDAYGHGLLSCANTLSVAGAKVFGVAEVEEGVALRNGGISGEIIILLGAPPESFPELIKYDLTPVVYDLANLRILADLAESLGKTVPVHLKVDIGMGRLGIMPDEIHTFIKGLQGMKGVQLAGIFGHYPVADAEDPSRTLGQCNHFASLMHGIDRLLLPQTIKHTANSAALLQYPETHFDMVRPGISLYGCFPASGLTCFQSVTLKPVMSFKTSVIQLKQVPANYGISYGHRYITEKDTRLAVLPVGYDDGYLRRLSGKAEVLIRGRRAPILGMICMNACMVDVTDIPEVLVGDEVVLMGRQGNREISAEQLAAWSGTINYEILCLFGGRNQKVYIH